MKRSPLRRRGRLRPGRKPKPRVSPESREAAYARTQGLCGCCCGRRAQGPPHHILPKQRWPELIDEPANLLPICFRCHQLHEEAIRRIPYYAIGSVWDLDLSEPQKRYIENTYPMDALML